MENFANLFQTYRLRQSFTNIIFYYPYSFVSAEDLHLNYVMNNGDLNNSIFVYNDFWEFQRIVARPSPGGEFPAANLFYAIYTNGTIYIQAGDVINRYDSSLNLKSRTNSYGCNHGMYYNSTSQLLYTGRCDQNNIIVYNKDLSYNRTISTSYIPWLISSYNDQLVIAENNIGNTTGNINFYQGESSYRTVATKCLRRVGTVLFDNNNQLIVFCWDKNIYLYNVNGTYIGMLGTACTNTNVGVLHAYFDSKDRIVVLCPDRVELYYG